MVDREPPELGLIYIPAKMKVVTIPTITKEDVFIHGLIVVFFYFRHVFAPSIVTGVKWFSFSRRDERAVLISTTAIIKDDPDAI